MAREKQTKSITFVHACDKATVFFCLLVVLDRLWSEWGELSFALYSLCEFRKYQIQKQKSTQFYDSLIKSCE